MLQVVFAGPCNFVAFLAHGKGLDPRTFDRQRTEKGCVRLAMWKHDHITIIDAVALVPVQVFLRVYQLPVLSQVLQSEEIVLQLNSFHLPVVVINIISSQSFHNLLSMRILLH